MVLLCEYKYYTVGYCRTSYNTEIEGAGLSLCIMKVAMLHGKRLHEFSILSVTK